MMGFRFAFLVISLAFTFNQALAADPIRSKIDFSDPLHPKFDFADISASDPFEGACPLDKLPEGMKKAADQLVEKVRESVSRIKTTRSSNCNQLKADMTSSQTQLQTALNNQLIGANPGTANPSQDLINSTTQKASALNQLVLTVSNLSQSSCINSTEDKIAIQKLFGQLVTFAGLIYGNWQGLAVAMGGQVVGNIPIFRDRVDRALQLFQKYDEKMEQREFLCLFRQMQKTECLMFADPKINVINGIDLSFQQGATHTTQESIRKIEKDSPQTLRDIQLLWTLHDKARGFSEKGRAFVGHKAEVAAGEAEKKSDDSVMDAFDELKPWCEKTDWKLLEEPERHPERIKTALEGIRDTCNQVKHVDYWTLIQTQNLSALIEKSYWQVRTLRDYYEEVRNHSLSPLGTVAATWESLKYFENYSASMIKARDPSQGSQDRINFRDLVNSLRLKLGKYTFRLMMQNNHRKLIRHGATLSIPPAAAPIQREAIKSMISLCQTLDPTLACLYADRPEGEKLFQRWVVRCVGPKSDLCKDLVKRDLVELERLIDDPKRWVYLLSVCNRGKGNLGLLAGVKPRPNHPKPGTLVPGF